MCVCVFDNLHRFSVRVKVADVGLCICALTFFSLSTLCIMMPNHPDYLSAVLKADLEVSKCLQFNLHILKCFRCFP